MIYDKSVTVELLLFYSRQFGDMTYGSKRESGRRRGKEREREFADVPKLQFVRYATLEMSSFLEGQVRPRKSA